MVKSSGPLNADLAFAWHYPTFKSATQALMAISSALAYGIN